MKPHYRLHFHLFDGKTPLWWVTCDDIWYPHTPTTNGYTNPASAILEAVKL